MDENIKIEKHNHPTRMTISKLKNNVFKYKRLVANANEIGLYYYTSGAPDFVGFE